MNVTQILQQHARNAADGVAIVDNVRGKSRQITYRELDQAVGRTATLLKESGLRPGDRVLLFHPMSIELYTALAAILRGGMTAMFIDPSAGRHYIDRCCEILPPAALIASSKAQALRLTSAELRKIPMKWSIGLPVPCTRRLERAKQCRDDAAVHECSSETAALISFTSGTTGEPKATVRTHDFLLAQHEAIESSLSLSPGDIELVTMPIFVLANLASQVTSIIADADLRRPAEIEPARVLQQIEHCHANRITASPAFFERLLTCCENSDRRLLSVKRILTGGGPVPPRLLERIHRVAPQAELTVVYGSTEAEPISTVTAAQMQPADHVAMRAGKGLLVGRPVPALDVKILQDSWGQSVGALERRQFESLCCSAGSAGEIVVSGKHVLAGYADQQGEAENKFTVDGTVWHRTGDAGFFDTVGRLWLLGRCAARLCDERGAIYPLGVEQAAMRHAAIGHAAMVAHRGQRVLAVTLREPSSQPDLATLLKSLSYANVDSIRILKKIPVDPRHNSKVDYRALCRSLEAG